MVSPTPRRLSSKGHPHNRPCPVTPPAQGAQQPKLPSAVSWIPTEACCPPPSLFPSASSSRASPWEISPPVALPHSSLLVPWSKRESPPCSLEALGHLLWPAASAVSPHPPAPALPPGAPQRPGASALPTDIIASLTALACWRFSVKSPYGDMRGRSEPNGIRVSRCSGQTLTAAQARRRPRARWGPKDRTILDSHILAKQIGIRRSFSITGGVDAPSHGPSAATACVQIPAPSTSMCGAVTRDPASSSAWCV